VEPITLRAGSAGVEVVPDAGGTIARYWDEGGTRPLDWLRPATAAAVAARDLRRTGAFPLVPWSNRIRDGRFAYGGRAVVLPPNFLPQRHVIHGHGWRAAWRPLAVDAACTELEYRHAPDAWPWAYRAVQRIHLAPDRLTVGLAVTNESEAEMPVGLGWHPYFPRTPRATLTAPVTAMWLTDAEVMPTELVTPAAADPTGGLRVESTALDTCFTGWSGEAVIEWPEREARLRLTADAPLRFLVVFTPREFDFFCVEPASHVTDAVNLASAGRTDTGLRGLPPGETLATTVTLSPERAA
jgi:aldose 1-epimerase